MKVELYLFKIYLFIDFLFEGKVEMSDDDYLSKIQSLNDEQRKIFDDFVERIKDPTDEEPFYLYIGGKAGTGKSFLLKLLILY